MNANPHWDEARFMNDLSQHIEQLKGQASRLSDAIRFDQSESAFNVLQTLVEGCLLLVECLIKVEEVKGIPASASAWNGAEDALSAVIRDLISAFEKRDFVLVADLLEYDLIQTLDVWYGVINSSGGDSARLQNPVGG